MALKDITITGSINSYPTLSYGQKTYIASTDEQSFPIEHITGSAGGATPDFNGQVATTDLFVNITQSWEYNVDSPLGNIVETQDTEEEFINGEYSGSAIQVADQRLIDEDCIQYLTPSTVATNFKLYFYNTPTFPIITTGNDPEYLTAKAYRDNFLNPNTSPNPGEIYILRTVSEKFEVSPVLPPQGKLLLSYKRWAYGADFYDPSTDTSISKWQILDNEAQAAKNGDFLNFSLYSLGVNGGPVIGVSPSPSIIVGSSGIQYFPPTYQNNEYGIFPINYVDFINEQLETYGFSSRIIGSSITNAKKFICNYFTSENFTFVFKEAGQLNGNKIPTFYYIIYSDQGNIYDDVLDESQLKTYEFTSGKQWNIYTP